MENIKIISSTATIKFQPVSHLNTSKEILKSKLINEYPNFNEVSMPPDAPPLFPRFVAVSHHGYSNIMISTDSVQFSTRFDDAYNGLWNEKCKPYIQRHIDSIFEIICPLYKNILFCGLNLSIIKSTEIESSAEIEQKYLKNKFVGKPLYDVSIKETYKYDDDFYINITLQNQRVLPFDNNDHNFSLPKVEQKKIKGIYLDVNDRNAANYKKDYISSKDKFDKIMAISTMALNEYVPKL